MHLKISCGKWQPFCLACIVLTNGLNACSSFGTKLLPEPIFVFGFLVTNYSDIYQKQALQWNLNQNDHDGGGGGGGGGDAFEASMRPIMTSVFMHAIPQCSQMHCDSTGSPVIEMIY